MIRDKYCDGNNGINIAFKKGDVDFYALLATPNAQAAMYLIKDYGTRFQISDIKKIVLLAGNSLEVHFEDNGQKLT